MNTIKKLKLEDEQGTNFLNRAFLNTKSFIKYIFARGG
jgi:hypothetical protein